MRGGKLKKSTPVPPKPSLQQKKQSASIAKIYKQYALDDGIIGTDGITKLCKDMKINMASDAQILVFMYMSGSQEYGKIKAQQFSKVLTRMHVDSKKNLESRKKYLTDFLKDFKDSEFKDFFKWIWGYHKQPISKSIDKQMAVALMNMVIGKVCPLTTKLTKFLLEVKTEVKGITKDQWTNILDFCSTISADMSNYDDMSAWPLLLDEFYEWASNAK